MYQNPRSACDDCDSHSLAAVIQEIKNLLKLDNVQLGKVYRGAALSDAYVFGDNTKGKTRLRARLAHAQIASAWLSTKYSFDRHFISNKVAVRARQSQQGLRAKEEVTALTHHGTRPTAPSRNVIFRMRNCYDCGYSI